MSRFELIRTESGEAIRAGETITIEGLKGPFDAEVIELETPEYDFCGCVHYKDPNGMDHTCSAEALGAEWHFDGAPFRPDPDDREAFDSGRWTQEDTDSMERGRDLPMRNEAGEWMP